jgi:UPF0755 protein
MPRILKLLLSIIVLSFAGTIGFWLWVSSSVKAPHVHDKADKIIVIEKGSSLNAILDKLGDEGVISGKWAIWFYLRPQGDQLNLKAGEYRFPSPISAVEVVKILQGGQIAAERLTIPEGFTRFDIAKRLAENFPGEPALNEQQILKLMDDTSLIADIDPLAPNLEGYMFATTYFVSPKSDPKTLIKMMVDQFRSTWKPEWTERAKELGKTPREIVTIASLVETESKVESERPTVASVIYNRLERDMALGIDMTVVYVAKMEGRWDGIIHRSDLQADSPYNTRRFKGLPPGPIASVSENAIIAALNPETTKYLFYVLDVEKNDGSHLFYESAAAFEVGKAKYQAWLAKQRNQ